MAANVPLVVQSPEFNGFAAIGCKINQLSTFAVSLSVSELYRTWVGYPLIWHFGCQSTTEHNYLFHNKYLISLYLYG